MTGVTRVAATTGVVAAAYLWCAVHAPVYAHVGPDEMARDAEAALARQPDDGAAHLTLARVYQSAKRWDEALVAYDDALAHGADRDQCDGGRAQVLLAAGFPRLALRTLDGVLARRPDAAGLRFDRGRAHLALGDPTSAADDFGQAIAGLPRLTPEHVLTHRDALLQAGRPDAALAALDAGMARLGPIASLQLEAIEMESTREHWDAALGRLDQLLRQAPKSEAWVARRGDLLDRLGRRDEARREWERALALIRSRPRGRRPAALHTLEEHLRGALAPALARDSTTTNPRGNAR